MTERLRIMISAENTDNFIYFFKTKYKEVLYVSEVVGYVHLFKNI